MTVSHLVTDALGTSAEWEFVRVATLLSSAPLALSGQQKPVTRELPAGAGEPPIAVLAAEIALLHARLDDLQSRLDK